VSTYKTPEAAAKAVLKAHGIYAVPGGYLATPDAATAKALGFYAKKIRNGRGDYLGLLSGVTGRICHGYYDTVPTLTTRGLIVHSGPVAYTTRQG